MQSGGTLIVDLGRLNGAAALSEGTNVRYEVLYDDTSVRVSVICDEEPHPESNPTPDPGPVVPVP